MFLLLLLLISLGYSIPPPTTMAPNAMSPQRPFAMNTQELERQMLEKHNQDLRFLVDKYLLDQQMKGSLRNANRRLFREMKLNNLDAKATFHRTLAMRGSSPNYKPSIDKWHQLELNSKFLRRIAKTSLHNNLDYTGLYTKAFKGDVNFPLLKHIYKRADFLKTGPNKAFNTFIRPDGDLSIDDIDTDANYWANKYFARK
ncbi:hypothetical protein EIN_230120 [Entamoeba invadens IP1]|uniref:Uncharacterized protein n=1 Tax=Entamoeba invadens IP1 TaxID=370355 RepID=A0A0A1U359_ENTIV|nr:hypothetical protein EIN_230120 [Entamoeba invadens IP1]ELP88459.1 hypothetical protein EIN_230120 [Entamoeba invadens IP1]|eukprot:XP_004255230.1 hypothetical protein EIN_230120 [Entamoeba invadens IP1]